MRINDITTAVKQFYTIVLNNLRMLKMIRRSTLNYGFPINSMFNIHNNISYSLCNWKLHLITSINRLIHIELVGRKETIYRCIDIFSFLFVYFDAIYLLIFRPTCDDIQIIHADRFLIYTFT